MKTRIKKIGTRFVLIFFILSNFFIPILSAENNNFSKIKNKKEIILKNKFIGKKLNRIKKSLKGKKYYKLMIKSDKGLNSITNFFNTGDKNSKIKKLGEDKYMIKLPINSQFLNKELSIMG